MESRSLTRQLPGLLVAAVGVAVAWTISREVPALPMLTAALLIGILLANVTGVRQHAAGKLAPGLTFSARTLLRLGIVLLGLQLSLADLLGLGWWGLLAILGLVPLSFLAIAAMSRAVGLARDESLLMASGFSICGASAIGAAAAVTRTAPERQAAAVAMVTLCGTVSIALYPLLGSLLMLDDGRLGWWIGAGIQDVGQVAAAAGGVGTGVLGIAVIVKLTRVVLLAPVTAGISLLVRSRPAWAGHGEIGSRPPLLPLFVAGFLAMVVLRSTGILPGAALAVLADVQHAVLGAALVGLGAQIRIGRLLSTDRRTVLAGVLAWIVIAAASLGLALLLG